MDAVTPGAPSGDDDQVAHARLGGPPAARRETDRATEHERVRHIPLVEQGRSVDRGDTHLVAVVGDAGHHPRVDPLRRQSPRREGVRRCIERTEAEDIGIGDRLGRDPQHVAHDPAHSGIRAAERLQGAGMIVRLDLERDLMVAIEGNDTGVVPEGREHPGPVDLVGGRHDGGLQETPDQEIRRSGLAVMDRRLERPVRTVLRPGLGDGLQLDVGGVTALRRIVVAHGLQILQWEREQLPRAEVLQRGGVESSQWDRLDRGIGRRIRHEGAAPPIEVGRTGCGSPGHALDDGCAQGGAPRRRRWPARQRRGGDSGVRLWRALPEIHRGLAPRRGCRPPRRSLRGGAESRSAIRHLAMETPRAWARR